MRTRVGALLFAVSVGGCNAIFGIPDPELNPSINAGSPGVSGSGGSDGVGGSTGGVGGVHPGGTSGTSGTSGSAGSAGSSGIGGASGSKGGSGGTPHGGSAGSGATGGNGAGGHPGGSAGAGATSAGGLGGGGAKAGNGGTGPAGQAGSPQGLGGMGGSGVAGAGGTSPVTCDQTGTTCETCATCAKTSAACGSAWSQCAADPNCVTIDNCVFSCPDSDGSCNASCFTGQPPSSIGLHIAYAGCAACSECTGDCTNSALFACSGTGGQGGMGQGGSGPPVLGPMCPTPTAPAADMCTALNMVGASCQDCVNCASSGPCGQINTNCDTNCQDYGTCASKCASDALDCLFGCEANYGAGLCAYYELSNCEITTCAASCLSPAPVIAACPGTALFQPGDSGPSGCIRLADLMPDPQFSGIDVCYNDGMSNIGPLFGNAAGIGELKYGQVTKLLPVKANHVLTVWTTAYGGCDPAKNPPLGSTIQLSVGVSQTVTLTQTGSSVTGETPVLGQFEIDPPQPPTDTALRVFDGFHGTAGGLKYLVPSFGEIATGSLGSMITDSGVLGQDALFYLANAPTNVYLEAQDGSGVTFSGQSAMTLPRGPLSSGTYTIYDIGIEGSTVYPPHTLICDDNIDSGNFNSCGAL